MKVTGILSISNGTALGYPFPVVVSSLSKLCDNVIVGVDPSYPEDRETVEQLTLGNVSLVDSVWDRSNRDAGSEIAIKMDELTGIAKSQSSDWVVVMQADEVIHDDDFKMLRSFMRRHLDSDVNGFSMERIYFWKNLVTVREDWNANLVRVFKPSSYSFMAEGTDKAGMFSAPISLGAEVYLPYKIYHYSRVDDPRSISKRVRNLDSFFHTEDNLIGQDALPDYDFVTREFDNFAKIGKPTTVKGTLVPFSGSHPAGVEEWYSA